MPKVPVTCQECGKKFEVNQSDIKRGGGKYCSIKCVGRAHTGKNSSNWKPKIKLVCEECGKEFEVKHYQAKNGSRKYCSHECSEKAHSGEKNPNWKQKIIRICEECGKEFEVNPYWFQSGRCKYCSRKCKGKAQKKTLKGQNNPNWKNAQIKRICKNCGKEFFVYQSELKWSSREYCSTECSGDAPKKPNRICLICNKEFYVNPFRLKNDRGGKFCSKECLGIWHSQNMSGANAPSYKGKIKKICPSCGKEFERFPCRVENSDANYCSRKCQRKEFGKQHTGENNPRWLGGISFEPYCPKFNNEFRERVRTYYAYKCILCGKTQEHNGRKLSVHHVNYKKEACCDEDIPRYFVTLCVSCHAKTNNNREKYQKQFEKMIEKRFGGRSYFHKKEQLSYYGA